MIQNGALSYDLPGRVAYVNDQPLDLSARELGLLEILLQRAGRLVSKEQLVQHLCEWGEEVSTNAIEVYVHRLRKKIESGASIVTMRGLGYCMEKAAAPSAVAATALTAMPIEVPVSVLIEVPIKAPAVTLNPAR